MSKKSKLSVILNGVAKVLKPVSDIVSSVCEIPISISKDKRKIQITRDNNATDEREKDKEHSFQLQKQRTNDIHSNPNLTEEQKYILYRSAVMTYHVERNTFDD